MAKRLSHPTESVLDRITRRGMLLFVTAAALYLAYHIIPFAAHQFHITADPKPAVAIIGGE